MNPQPTIFISSIISEFYDLRGALRYFLGKSGFRVLISEESDFGADCGKDSLDNCKNQIEKSDYYLLIIGNKPGTIFEIDGKETTVTFEEFKHYIHLVKNGKSLNLIAFVRQQTWDAFEAKDAHNIHQLQIDLLNELLTNSLFDDLKIGRWRYKFDRFADIINVLETNQNGLFIETTRKISLYRNYIKREVCDILKTFVEKDRTSGKLKAVTKVIELPEIENLNILDQQKIPANIASKIIVFLLIISNKETLLRKLNRVFNYIAQGEFSHFDPILETYVLPEYIKLTMQTIEILERIFDNSKNIELLEGIRKRDCHNFFINQMEYDMVKGLFDDLNTVISKLVNLTNLFAKNWQDLDKKPDSFYSYGRSRFGITDEDIIEFTDNYFPKTG